MFKNSKSLKIMPYEVEHMPILKDWFYSGDYPEFFRDMLVLTDEQLKIYSYMKDGQSFVIYKDKEVIGFIILYEYRTVPSNIKLSILIDKKYQAKGYALEAMQMITEYVFNKLHIYKLIVEVCQINKRIQELLIKGGFEYECTLLKEAFMDGKRTDSVRYFMEQEKYYLIGGKNGD